jgi:serine/threonine protein kinase/tetratricopeptide (TPR) repeat protein
VSRERHERIAELFLAAADLSPEARSRYLGQACGADWELRRELDELLERDAHSAIMDHGLVLPSLPLPVEGSCGPASGAPERDESDRVVGASGPRFVGQYEVLGLLGQGGMGAVYRARQASPSRVVALKIIHPALLTPALLRRFEFEAQILAELQHPGIAQIFEAGTADVHGQRLPFFAMELIEGLPLTSYADQAQLDVRQRLRLLQRVCDAVQHAHQKGVIHRDLKPGNILVKEETERQGDEETKRRRDEVKEKTGGSSSGASGDAAAHSVASSLRLSVSSCRLAQPKVLDFGIARATAPELRSATLETQPGQIIGTLPYMSPEQLAADPSAIDVRSDVYALGVIAYELLAGQLPHDIRGASLADALRIRTNSLPLPLGRLERRFRGDIETIVGKAMEPDLNRRYASAAELAREIQRHLDGDPIEARRAGRLYVLKKTLWRNRVPVAVGGLLLLVLAAATVVSTWFALGEARQRRVAELKTEQTEQVSRFQSEMLERIDAAAMGRGLAQRYRQQVEAALARRGMGEWPERRARTQEEIDAAMAAFDATVAGVEGADIARGVLDEHVLRAAARTLDDRAGDPPLVRAQLHRAIGSAYRSLALYDAAERQMRAALDLRIGELGRAHADVADSLNDLAMTLQEKGDVAAAEPLYREALEISRRTRGSDDPRTAMILVQLAGVFKARTERARAESMYREALAVLRARPGDDERIAGVLDNLGVLLSEKGEYADAEASHREALAIRKKGGTNPSDTAICLNNLSQVLGRRGRLAEAEELQRESLALSERRLGNEHPYTLITLRNLANTLQSAGKPAEAEAFQLRAIELGRRLYGDKDPEIARNLSGLGLARQARGDLEGATPLLRDALNIVLAQPDPSPADVGRAMNNLASLHHSKREYEAAHALYRQAIEVLQEVLGHDHPDLAGPHNNLAAMLRDRGDFVAAEPVYREAIRLLRLTSEENPSLGVSLAGFARVLAGAGDHRAAEPAFREALQILAKQPDVYSERIVLTQTLLAASLVALERFAEAEGLLLAARAALLEGGGKLQRVLPSVLEALISMYERWESAEPGQGYAGRAAEYRERLAELQD